MSVDSAITRRQFLRYTAHLGLSATAVALLDGCGIIPAATPTRIWRVGLFHVGLDHVPPSLDGLREGLKTFGYEEGKNIQLDWRNLSDEAAADSTARDFVQSRVDVIVAFENQTVRAAKAATTDIPIVFLHVSDPIAAGFVTSFSHPGGNLTGLYGFRDSPGKVIDLFKALVPGLRRLLVLTDPSDPSAKSLVEESRAAAMALNLQLLERNVVRQTDIDLVLNSFARGEVDGIILASPNVQNRFSTLLARQSVESGFAFASHRREFVTEGALFSYGPDYFFVGKSAARYVDKLLKGVKPIDLPVEEITQLQLIINLKTAKELGLTIPQSILAQATEVIQ